MSMIGLKKPPGLSRAQIASGDDQDHGYRCVNVAAIIVTYNPDYATFLCGLSKIADRKSVV